MARKTRSPDETTTTADQTEAGGSSDGEHESMSGFFRRQFRTNPKLLKKRGIEEVLQKWLEANPGHTEVPQRVRQAASNAKMVEKKKRRKRKRGEAEAAAAANGSQPAAPRTPLKVLQTLEVQIDQCLAQARTLDPQGLAEVIESLRRARNEVILKQGKQGTA
jgi:hypothetical protein